MANVKISQLTQVSSATSGLELEVNESGTSKKVTAGQLKTFVQDNPTVTAGMVLTGSSASVDFTITNTATGAADPDVQLILDSGNTNGEALVDFRKGGVTEGRITALNGNLRLTHDSGVVEVAPSGSGVVAYFDATGIHADNLLSGQYTPTLTGVTNVQASTSSLANYYRVGSMVTVFGIVGLDPTTTSIDTELGISLPISTTFAGSARCSGSGACIATGAYGDSAAIVADSTNNRARFLCRPSSAANRNWAFSFSYYLA